VCLDVKDYGQLKELISDKKWRQSSKWESISETCW